MPSMRDFPGSPVVKTQGLHSKKIRDIKGTFHAKMGSIKDRYGMGLTETGDTLYFI